MNEESESNHNLADHCFICKVFFDRNLKRSRRRILRDHDDLVAPFLYLLNFASKTGTWFMANEMRFNFSPISHRNMTKLQQMFACRKCFEKVNKLEKDLQNFEKEISLMLDQSCDTLLNMDIISGDSKKVEEKLKEQQEKKLKSRKVRNVGKKKKSKVVKKKKVKLEEKEKQIQIQSLQQAQQPQMQKTKQILVVAKGAEGEQQQLLLLQVPANDSENENSQPIQAILDHQYHHQEEQPHVFLNSNSIPVTTCVTVSGDEQELVEVQFQDQDEHEREHDNEGKNEMVNDAIFSKRNVSSETKEAVSSITTASWNDGVIVFSENAFKRKAQVLDDEKSIDMETDSKDKIKLKMKRNYSPRSSSPLPPAGESRLLVHLMYGSKQWKRNIEGDFKSIIRDMALGRLDPAGRKIANSEKLCSAVIKNYSKRLVSECKDASRTIRLQDHQDICQLDIKKYTTEVFQKCPMTANFIKSLIPVDPRDTLDEHGATAVIMGVILYMQSMQSNILQHILSYQLRRAGCNREGFKQLHSLGLTLSYTSILKIMSDINEQMEEIYNAEKSMERIEKSIDEVVGQKPKQDNEKQNKRKAGAQNQTNNNQELTEEEQANMMLHLYYPQGYGSSDKPTTITYTTGSYPNTIELAPHQYETNNSNVYNE